MTHRALALLLLAAVLSGCCSVSTSGAGYQRRCVPSPFGKGKMGPASRHAPVPRERPAVHWEPDLGVYSVLTRCCHWVRLGTYYRLLDGQWQSAPWIEGPWSRIGENALPGRLAQVDECDPDP